MECSFSSYFNFFNNFFPVEKTDVAWNIFWTRKSRRFINGSIYLTFPNYYSIKKLNREKENSDKNRDVV